MIHLEIDKAVRNGDYIDIYGTAEFLESGTYELRYYDYAIDNWATLLVDGDQVINGVLGNVEESKIQSDTINVDLIGTTESGYRESITKRLTIEVPTPTPTETPTDTPTPTPVEFTDEELFVDLNDEFNGKEITFITDIEGIAKGTAFDHYTVEAVSVDTEDVVYSFTGTEAVEGEVDDEGKITAYGTVGQLDSTLLMNGYYRIVLTAYAEEGFLSDEVVVLVTGQAKIGNFTMTFNDMTLPVSGLPVDVYRTYDSRQRNTLGDFGYGWTMSIGGPKISVSSPLGEGWGYARYESVIDGNAFWVPDYPHEVYIDWGNGASDKFEMKLSPKEWMDPPFNTVEAYFMNKTGNGDTLEIVDSHTGMSYDIATHSILNDEYVLFEPQEFLLTRPDGMKYYFTMERGLYKVEDTYGRTITIGDNGIVYSDGTDSKTAFFNRDAEGKITSISYDKMKVTYSYDANDDLIETTNVGGYETYFIYEDHYLMNVDNDPNDGTLLSTNEYDADGRVISITDSNGKKTIITHNLNERKEITQDRLGNPTIYEYDERGNVLSVTDARNNTTYYTYDGHNNKTSETLPNGTTYTYEYDAHDNLISAKDNKGRKIDTDYNGKGAITRVSVMGSDELNLVYDTHGNPTSVTDAAGNTKNYDYDTKGNLTGVSDNIGTVMTMTYKDGHVESVINAENQKTTFTYDDKDRLKTRTYEYEGQQRTDTYFYDASNRVTEIRYADSTSVKYAYNQAGDVITATDSLGRPVYYDYDLLGNLTSIRYPDGTSEQFSYNAEGWNTFATDRLGRTIEFQYDEVGNVVKKIYPNNKFEEYEYDACNRLITATNVYGAITRYTYDYLGRCEKITDPDGHETEYAYDFKGNVSSITDAKGNTYEFTYDSNGNQTSVKYPDFNNDGNNSLFEYEYDSRGRLVSGKDAYGHETTYDYDGLDRLISVTDAKGNTWSCEYDELGNVSKVTDAKGYSTLYDYDYESDGVLITVTNAAGQEAKTKYDLHGRILYSTDFGGTKTEYEYDSNDPHDNVHKAIVNGEETIYSYNPKGILTSVEDPSGTIDYSYNGDGFLSSVTNANGETISYSYNNGYQLSKITIDNQDISYDYDTQGRLISVTDSEGTTSYTYDENGSLESTTYPNGVVTTYEYNSINALVKQVTRDGNGILLTSYEYTIGANGERTSVKELGRTVDYEYDELNRLVKETVTRGVNVSIMEYEYDANSNRTKMIKDGVVTAYTYNELNQITKAGDINYTWDNAGNLVSQSTDTGVLVASYTYDSHNRMISANVSNVSGNIVETYTYDYLGNRTSKNSNGVTTKYTTDLSTGYSQVLKAETGSKTVYYTRGFELISRREGSTASYYVYDGGLSVRALTDETGAVTDTLVFDAFGNATEKTGTTENPYGFQGEEQDATGLYYLRARYMDPSTGTFTTMDTYGGSLSDPMSLHKYLFANANPVMYCDPSGHEASLHGMVAAMAISGVLLAVDNGVLYYIQNKESDTQKYGKTTFGWNVATAAMNGFLNGFILGFIGYALCSILLVRIVLSVLGICLGFQRASAGIDELLSSGGNAERGLYNYLSGLLLIGVSAYGLARDLAEYLSQYGDGIQAMAKADEYPYSEYKPNENNNIPPDDSKYGFNSNNSEPEIPQGDIIEGTSYDTSKLVKTQGNVNPIQVKNMAESIQSKGPNSMPPIKVVVHDGTAYIVDGHHRYEAYTSLGYQRVPIKYVHKYSLGKAAASNRTLNDILTGARLWGG